MNKITLPFPYLTAISDFMEIIALAMILSIFCTSLTEVLKNVLAPKFCGKNSTCMIALSGLVSLFVGIFWRFCFAKNDLSFADSLWLSASLWLGSQGFFISLEESDGFLGKYFRRFGEITESFSPPQDLSCEELLSENAALKEEILSLRKQLDLPVIPPPDAPDDESEPFRFPVNYIAVSTPFTPQEHYAVDFGWSRSNGGPSQNIFSAFSGTVDMAGFYSGGAGNMVRIYFDDTKNNCRWYGIYKHLSEITVKAGDNISLGDKIGKMGSTGDAEGNHLHFDLIKAGYAERYTQTEKNRAKYSVDPIKFLYAYPEQTVGEVTDEKYNIKRLVKT